VLRAGIDDRGGHWKGTRSLQVQLGAQQSPSVGPDGQTLAIAPDPWATTGKQPLKGAAMGVVIPLDAMQLTMRWSVAGDAEFMVCTLGIIEVTGGRTPSVLAADIFAAWDASTMTTAANISTGWSVGTCFLTYQTGSGPVTFEGGGVLSGSNAGTTLPNNCAVLLKKQTNFGGRSNRGRMYLPSGYLPESVVNQVGTIDPATVTSLTTMWGTFVDNLTGDSIQPALLHSDGSGATPITSFVVAPKIATQRTRMRR